MRRLRGGRPKNATVQIAYEVSSYGFKVILAWSPKYANDLTGAEFLVTLVRGSGPPYEVRWEELAHHVFVFDVVPDDVYVWKDTTHGHQSLSSLELSDFCINLLLDALEKHKPWQVR